MPGHIPLHLAAPVIEIDAARVAEDLGLSEPEFRRHMEHGRITLLCERGTGEDAGYYGERRARLIVDERGRVLDHGTHAGT